MPSRTTTTSSSTGRLLLLLLLATTVVVDSFHIVYMGARRGKGGLKENLDGSSSSKKGGKQQSAKSLNKGKGQEITGVTLPADGTCCIVVCIFNVIC